MFDEDDLLPLSALQHLLYCERQWGLIHLEGLWQENLLTAEGRILHERAHDQGVVSRGDLRVAYGLSVRSLKLGLIGKADVVEFHRLRAPDGSPLDDLSSGGVRLAGVSGFWQPVPVEYKRGHPKPNHCDEAQLCAQALCLEEMLGASIPDAALYYGSEHRRCGVTLDEALRSETLRTIERLHSLTQVGRTPPPLYRREKCDRCSLIDVCLPRAADGRHSARKYLDEALAPPGENCA